LRWPAALGAVALLAGCGGGSGRPPPAPFLPKLVRPAGPVQVLLRRPGAPGAPSLHRYEYVVDDRELDVYDARPPFRLEERIRIPAAHALRGVAVSPVTRRLYFSVGGNGGASGDGALVAFDLLANRVLWQRGFPTGADSPAITPDGRTLYLPEGERTTDDVWYAVDARTGRVRAEIHAAPGPHNTIASRVRPLVYLGPRNSRWLVVASTRTNRVVEKVGPLKGGVRPFTVDERRGLAYTTASAFLGFQVSSLRTGKLLYTVPIRFPWRGSLGTPSHGISLSPDGRDLEVIDVPNGIVHAYDVSGVPARPPRHVADVRLRPGMRGRETPCGGDCGRAGWLQHSLDGRYVFVGDDGDVVAVRTHRVVGFLPALRQSRYPFELDWRGSRPVATSTRSGYAPAP
jgi:sugar lactone lactonase YvrE